MKKRKIVFGVLWLTGLLLIFVAATTDLLLDDQESDYPRISVVWDETTEDYVENYKHYMTRYLDLKSLDFHFCTIDEPVNAKQQMEIILREEESGADLILVKPVEEAELEELLEQSSLSVPLLCMDGKMESDSVNVSLYSDEQQRGRHLAERIQKDYPGWEICLLSDGRNTGRDERIYQAMKEKAGETQVRLCQWEENGRLSDVTEDAQNMVFVASNPRLLEEAADQNEKGYPLYGFGYNDRILYAMEQGQIQGINVYSAFQMGWESIRYAFKILDGEDYEKEVILEDSTIGAEEIFDQEYEDILFYL